jgi:phosphoribosylformylglycinamidine cyclo-ligase
MALTYDDAGVDIDRGDRFARFIASIPSKAVSRGIGGFAGGIEFDPGKYRHPLLLTTTDGVGTKLLVAQELGKFDTIGIDLVAMSVNDLIVCGAKPEVFLDYIACGRIDETLLHSIIAGVVAGCEEAGCVLAGGETAEMPDLYRPSDFDLAGFCVGFVERDEALPKKGSIRAGDSILGLPSRGVHSNGLSLARKAIPKTERGLWEELLVPTKIYVRELSTLIGTGKIKAAAHITGGGLTGNFIRVIPDTVKPRFSRNWPVPPIFDAIAGMGHVEAAEMEKVFNMGIGIAFVTGRDDANTVIDAADREGIPILEIGDLIHG